MFYDAEFVYRVCNKGGFPDLDAIDDFNTSAIVDRCNITCM